MPFFYFCGKSTAIQRINTMHPEKTEQGGDASRPANEAGDASALIFMRSAAVKGEKEK